MEQVKTIICAVKGYDSVDLNAETRLIEDLHFDSMEMMDLIDRLEQEFEITFSDEDLDLEHFETTRVLLETVRRYVGFDRDS